MVSQKRARYCQNNTLKKTFWRERKLDEERAKVYGVEPDIRHWRLAVYGLIDTWMLKQVLSVKESRYARTEEAVWMTLNKLNEKECQRLLIQKAVEEISTGPDAWGNETVKEWAVKEFGLTPNVFLKEEKQ